MQKIEVQNYQEHSNAPHPVICYSLSWIVPNGTAASGVQGAYPQHWKDYPTESTTYGLPGVTQKSW